MEKGADLLVDIAKLHITLSVAAIGVAAAFIRFFDFLTVQIFLILPIIGLFATLVLGFRILRRMAGIYSLVDLDEDEDVAGSLDPVIDKVVAERTQWMSGLFLFNLALIVLIVFAGVAAPQLIDTSSSPISGKIPS